ncbi:unnamed protein product [Blepharisma stoltei]|uniref:Uncharacterized protein n=1 Tax=Blepharisma stoltei TaxID=1481888 RepID=A0AAU9JX68_9CILI|nr:unnamed protein product [Blepharisma stoltei]
MIKEINEKSLTCINELRTLGKALAINQLETTVKINLENLKAHNEKIESMIKLFENKDIVPQLNCKNLHIEINVNEPVFERSDYYGAQIGEINEIKSIESGQLVYK